MSINSIEDLRNAISNDDLSNDVLDSENTENANSETTENTEENENQEKSNEVVSYEENKKNEEVKDPEEGEEEEENGYTPTGIYKAMGEEHKIDEWLLSAIKNEEQEEAIRRIYEKAAGLDYYEQKHNKLLENYNAVNSEYSEVKNNLEYLGKLAEDGNYLQFFKQLGVDEDNILQLANKILELKDLTPEQQEEYNKYVEGSARARQLELENQQYQEMAEKQKQEEIMSDLETVFSIPEVQSLAQEFDSRLGEEGAFVQEVINFAAAIEEQTKDSPTGMVTLSPEDAILEVAKRYGLGQSTGNSPKEDGTKPPVDSTPENTVIRNPKKEGLPTIKGNSTSPVKRVVNNLDDLRRIADSFNE